MKRHAVLDIGTNTFHLLIVEGDDILNLKVIYQKSIPVKLKEGGLDKGHIRPKPFQRGLDAMAIHDMTLKKFKVDDVVAIGTAALRIALNGSEFMEQVKADYNINIHIITGEQEADLIYKGVNCFDHLDENSLIVDIGGGSVEFIIANGDEMIWKRSYPIGASILKNSFQKNDPIAAQSVLYLESYLKEVLEEMFIIAQKYQVETIVGTSGSFETIYDILNYGEEPRKNIWHRFIIDIDKYKMLHDKILHLDQKERLKIPGMTPFRADMMVVGSILINFIFRNLPISKLFLARTAIKEGLLWCILNNQVKKYVE